jgi:dihydrofolate reductase
MAQLIYSAVMSLDGYIADKDGRFGWAEPDEEVHAFVNDLDRPVGTHLYGRRMYETMRAWETDPSLADHSPLYAGLRGHMAVSRQGRVLHDAGYGIYSQDAAGASLRA